MTHEDAGAGRVSVWATGQRQARVQRAGRYARLSFEHPGKMLPAIARHAITAYTRPGDVVADPMCGIGTSLVEAVHLGRDAVGVELEARWASIARMNLRTAAEEGATGRARVHTGDARFLTAGLAEELAGRVGLVLTSPPYGAMTHGQVRTLRDGGSPGGVDKRCHTYSTTRSRTNLAHQRPEELVDSLRRILAGCRPLLREGGVVAVTARPYRVRGMLVDFPGQVVAAGEAAGLVLADRCAALLCALRGGGLVSRGSFFQVYETRRLRGRGLPVQLISHEDVLVFTDPAHGARGRAARHELQGSRSPDRSAA